MSAIKTILWACDFFKASNNALEYANSIAKIFKAEIIGLHVIQEPTWSCYEVDEEYCERMIKHMKILMTERYETAVKKFQRIASSQKKKRIAFRYCIREGRASEEIAKCAQEEGAQLIIMGNSGDETTLTATVGSTVFKVMRATHVPTMVVKKVKRKGSIERILLPTDLKDSWPKAFDVTLEFADKFKAEIYLLHVIEIYNYEGVEEVQDQLLAYATKMIQESSNTLKKKAGEIAINEYARKSINSTIGILDFVNKYKIDMVVMGTHARTGLSKFFLGSVAEKVLSELEIPIIAVHPEDEE
ncbi:MAG: hypothetical protein A2Y62_18130 [Candidatus Fischerbacteria bacterium RBG_13_37_8]|uniref:UspA domain-containing protein n=1 Tax=Candidatus Fischerbacteria bacterium RBG_13_37_8 TaxID=1817863 RepID=A0A1F5VVY5_9BACT|nr:MAG: hypothetical protein A2Y62_18130 [Candidatus Fischerbacteria bacterium RBG_13_37_8]